MPQDVGEQLCPRLLCSGLRMLRLQHTEHTVAPPPHPTLLEVKISNFTLLLITVEYIYCLFDILCLIMLYIVFQVTHTSVYFRLVWRYTTVRWTASRQVTFNRSGCWPSCSLHPESYVSPLRSSCSVCPTGSTTSWSMRVGSASLQVRSACQCVMITSFFNVQTSRLQTDYRDSMNRWS